MFRSASSLLATLLAVLFLASPALAVDRAVLEAGQRAFGVGDYITARTVLQPLVERGEREAEFIYGVMHLRGLGFAQNPAIGAIWFYKAARKGEPGAQLVLGSQKLYGHGVRRNLVEAYMWLTLAVQSGAPEVVQQATTLRRDAQTRMGPGAIAEAERRAADFTPRSDGLVSTTP